MRTDAAGKVTKWVYDGNGNVLAVMYPDGTNESLFWLEGKIVAHTLTNGSTTTTEFFGTDALGSTVITTDASGKVVSQNDTTPFGTQTGSSGFQNLALRYTGKDYDSDTGLYYFNARWYDPQTGRFTTEDPIKDGSLWYAYVGNNPMTFTDPTGLVLVGAFSNTNIIADYASPGYDVIGSETVNSKIMASHFMPQFFGPHRVFPDRVVGQYSTTTVYTLANAGCEILTWSRIVNAINKPMREDSPNDFVKPSAGTPPLSQYVNAKGDLDISGYVRDQTNGKYEVGWESDASLMGYILDVLEEVNEKCFATARTEIPGGTHDANIVSVDDKGNVKVLPTSDLDDPNKRRYSLVNGSGNTTVTEIGFAVPTTLGADEVKRRAREKQAEAEAAAQAKREEEYRQEGLEIAKTGWRDKKAE